jgi:nucleoside-diphosphate-sugar epimerase
MGTYNVIEAAVTLGIRKIIIASSETTYGVIFAEYPREPRSLPLEEDYDTDPMDSYALSKVVNEKTARAFALRGDIDIYALRIGNVIEPHEYKDAVPKWKANPEARKKLTWSYIDARDLGEIVRLCIEKDGLGFQVFNAANNDSSADLPTRELVRRFYPNVPLTREMGEYESLYSNRKLREVLGFKERHPWRKNVGEG